jgi:hypothetical protein
VSGSSLLWPLQYAVQKMKIFKMAGAEGFEPTTIGFGDRYSTS